MIEKEMSHEEVVKRIIKLLTQTEDEFVEDTEVEEVKEAKTEKPMHIKIWTTNMTRRVPFDQSTEFTFCFDAWTHRYRNSEAMGDFAPHSRLLSLEEFKTLLEKAGLVWGNVGDFEIFLEGTEEGKINKNRIESLVKDIEKLAKAICEMADFLKSKGEGK